MTPKRDASPAALGPLLLGAGYLGMSEAMMNQSGNDESELRAFLRAELVGVELEGISLESVPVVRWRSALQSRLRAIAGYQDGTTVLPVADDMA
jgi:hypothetical protein